MIQPITNRIYSTNFKNSAVGTTIKPAAEVVIAPATTGSSDALLGYFKEKDIADKKKSTILMSVLILMYGAWMVSMIPGAKDKILRPFSKSGGKKDKYDFSSFTSLKDNNEIPTLETCKSINKKLKTFLENQVSYNKATKEQLEQAGTPQSANRLIMCGPPGSGKTFFSQIFAKSIGAEYRKINYKDLSKRYVGEHNENLKKIFDDVIKTAQKSPDKKFVINFDEIDSMIIDSADAAITTGYLVHKKEERGIFLLALEEMAQKTPNVIFIGTTNFSAKGRLDGATLSRFKYIVEVDYPEKQSLFEALNASIEALPKGEDFVKQNSENIEKLAQEMYDRGASFRDLNNIINESKNIYLRDIMENKSSSYKMDYLESAFKTLEVTDGEVAGKLKKSQ